MSQATCVPARSARTAVLAAALFCAPAASAACFDDVAAAFRETAAGYVSKGRQAGRVYRLDPVRSSAIAVIGRAGPLAAFGHDHVVAATQIDGFAWLPDVDAPGDARADAWLPVDGLEVDDPALRAAEGFESEPSAEDIAGTVRNMLETLDAGTRPWIRLRASIGDPYALKIALTVNGIEQVYRHAADIAAGDETLRVAGEFTMRHSDHGMRPFRALGGLLAVRDAIDIRYDLTLALWEVDQCAPAPGGL